MMKRYAILAAALMLVAATVAAQELPILSTDAPVGPRDVLEIRVLEDTTMNGRTTVTDDGFIILNVVGKVQVRSEERR